MSSNTGDVTVNCNSLTTGCDTIKATNNDAICKDGSSGNCVCNDAPAYGSDNAACTKSGLRCTDLTEAACEKSSDCKFENNTCGCDSSRNLVADEKNNGACVCAAGFE